MPPQSLPDPWQKPFFTVAEAAELLGTTPSNIYRRIRIGALPVVELSPRRYAVRTVDLLALAGLEAVAL